MTDAQLHRLEVIRQEVRLAASEIAEHQDSFACCERLVDALLAIIRFLEIEP